jgi:hypothetical protein
MYAYAYIKDTIQILLNSNKKPHTDRNSKPTDGYGRSLDCGLNLIPVMYSPLNS